MLNFMRQNANSWVMILLFAIIIFVFAINFGPWAGNNMSSVPYAVVVNNEAISLAEFRIQYANQFARIKQFRPDYDQAQADKDGLKQIVVENLVSRELLTQLGNKNQLSVPARTLALEIKERVFGEEAEFDKEEYIRRVNAFFQSSVSQFETQVAKEIVAEQMANLLGTAVFVSDEEARLSFKDKNTKIALEFVKVDPNFFKSTRAVNADEAKRFLDANAQKVSDYYNEHVSDYIKEPEVKASHILVKVPAKSTDAEKAALKEKAEKILARVKGNEDFAEVAKKESDDTGSKIKGGDLGYFSAGMMVEEFSKAAFALKPGEISNLVESPFGFHIIKQIDQKPKVERKLEEVSTEIAELLIKKEEQNQKAKEVASAALAQLKNGTALANVKISDLVNVKATGKAPSNPEAPVADETDLFSRNLPYVKKIGRLDGISEEAFKLTKENPTASQVVESNDAFFAIRLKSREDADMTKFEEQKETIVMSLVYPRRRAFMQQFLENLKEKAKIKYNDALLTAQVDLQ